MADRKLTIPEGGFWPAPEVPQESGSFMSSALPVAGFAIIEAATLEEAIELASRTPCVVAHGVVEVWPLREAP